MTTKIEETNIKGTREALKYVIAAVYGIFLTFLGMIYSELKEVNKKLADSEVVKAIQAQDILYLKEEVKAIKEDNTHRDEKIDKFLVFVKPDEIEMKQYGK